MSGTIILFILFYFGSYFISIQTAKYFSSRRTGYIKINKFFELILLLSPHKHEEKTIPIYSLLQQIILQVGMIVFIVVALTDQSKLDGALRFFAGCGMVSIFVGLIGASICRFLFEKKQDTQLRGNPELNIYEKTIEQELTGINNLSQTFIMKSLSSANQLMVTTGRGLKKQQYMVYNIGETLYFIKRTFFEIQHSILPKIIKLDTESAEVRLNSSKKNFKIEKNTISYIAMYSTMNSHRLKIDTDIKTYVVDADRYYQNASMIRHFFDFISIVACH